MSFLRDELTTARRAYAALHYPGDLPRELLPTGPQMRWRGVVIFGAMGASAVAAAAIVATLLLRPLLAPASAQPRPYLPLVTDMHLPQKLQFEFPSLPSIPGVPQDLSLRSVTPDLGLPAGWRLPFTAGEPEAHKASESPEHA